MNSHPLKPINKVLYRLLCIAITILLTNIQFSYGQGNSGSRGNPNQEILDRLDQLDAKLDALAGPQVTATFCISQGRALELGADWILQIDTEWEGGLGWAEVFSGEATAEIKIPAGVIPSESAIGVGANLGRGLDVCIDLPIEMGSNDTALLVELAEDINAKADNFPNRGKFQRRAHRLLNFTKRRVPGIQTRIASQSFSVTAADSEESNDDEFDIIDDAIESLMSGGFTGNGETFGVLKNQDVRSLVTSFDGLPMNITSMMENPEQVFDPLSEVLDSGIGNVDCLALGVDTTLRNQKPGLNRLCNGLEGLPDYELVEQVLSGELIADLYEALDTLTVGGSAAKVAASSKQKFCSSRIGQLFKYNIFCGR